MTCIIGLEHNGVIHLCGDSLGSSGWFGETRNNPKNVHCWKVCYRFVQM